MNCPEPTCGIYVPDIIGLYFHIQEHLDSAYIGMLEQQEKNRLAAKALYYKMKDGL